ncbi:nucleoside triphosphate pyrophosphohydrolase family protein [Vibrio breoganii]|uniref:nucleoside triphosphate pyrophosphohydrolase family protein n=1 Tax=Vibrio breoganii TaxID=553239 RepID=UPI0025B5738D|nr:nucleoside triphosphate pyrophosphohydrolase family protein [Vibrio breoganii]MDN3716814.1 nucleoside triphosphate pyrophosphohydrolase family protein [Vibrio breoganii]
MTAHKEFFSTFTQLTPKLWNKLYQDIVEFRQLFNLPINTGIESDKLCHLHSNLMIEELTELARATNKEDQADAITDTVYVAVGRAVHAGHEALNGTTTARQVDVLLNVAKTLDIPFEQCWDAVHASNMSKAALDEQQAKETVEVYSAKGVSADYKLKNDKYIVFCNQDSVATDGVMIKEGKILKNKYYEAVDLSFVG